MQEPVLGQASPEAEIVVKIRAQMGIPFFVDLEMTELETLIAVAGTLSAVALTRILDQRAEKQRVAREVALRPLEEKQASLYQFVQSINELCLKSFRTAVDPSRDRQLLKSLLDQLDVSFARAIIWLAKEETEQAVLSYDKIVETSTKIAKGGTVSAEELDRMLTAVVDASTTIAKELGVHLATVEYKRLIRSLSKA